MECVRIQTTLACLKEFNTDVSKLATAEFTSARGLGLCLDNRITGKRILAAHHPYGSATDSPPALDGGTTCFIDPSLWHWSLKDEKHPALELRNHGRRSPPLPTSTTGWNSLITGVKHPNLLCDADGRLRQSQESKSRNERFRGGDRSCRAGSIHG